MISTTSLKQKFFKKGYTGDLPNSYDDLLNLYISLYGPPDLDNWSKDKLVVKIKELNYDKPIPSTLPELRKIFLQLYKPKIISKQPKKSTIHDFTIAKLKENVHNMGYKGPNKKTKKEWYDLYVQYSTGTKENVTTVNMTVQQLRDELVKLGYKGGTSKKKKDELINIYTKLSGLSKDEKPDMNVEKPSTAISPVKQLNLDNTTINEIKHQVKKLGYTGPLQKNKQGWIDVYKKLVDTSCKQVGKFTYSITPLGLTKNQIETKFHGINVGIVYTVCKNNKCTFTIDGGVEKYKQFVFVMQNSKGMYDGMEVNGHQVLTIDELPENLYDKLIGKCNIKDVSKEVMNFIEKIEKKTKSVCDNLLENYKIIPTDKDGNCFFQAIGNALNIPMKKVREMMANNLTQHLVDIRNEFGHSNKTLGQYKDELLKEGTFVSDYDVEQLFPISFPGIGLIILNMNSKNGCDITCSSTLLENKNKYIVLLFQRDPSLDKDNGAHYDLISIKSKPVLSYGELSNKLIQHVHKQCKTIQLAQKELDVQPPVVEKELDVQPPVVQKELLPVVEKELDVQPPVVQKELLDVQEKELDVTKNLELMKKEDVKKMLKEKGYVGILPKYKSELIEIYKKLYNKKDDKPVDKSFKPLDKMTLQEIQTELQKKNITKYLPRTKTELIKLYNADRCDPIQEQWCTGDKVCDLRNNVCMDKVDIKPTKNTSIVFETMNGHPIAGTSAILYQLKHAIKNKKQIEPISLTMPTSIEGTDTIKVNTLEELKQMLNNLTQQNSFYKLVSRLV